MHGFFSQDFVFTANMSLDLLIETFGNEFFHETVLELYTSAKCVGVIVFEPMVLLLGDMLETFDLTLITDAFDQSESKFLFLAYNVQSKKQFFVVIAPHSMKTKHYHLAKLWNCEIDSSSNMDQVRNAFSSIKHTIPQKAFLVGENMVPATVDTINAA